MESSRNDGLGSEFIVQQSITTTSLFRLSQHNFNHDNQNIVIYLSISFYRIICLKIDKDNDGYISHDELKDWVKHVTHR